MKVYKFTATGLYLGAYVIVAAPTLLKAKNLAKKRMQEMNLKPDNDTFSNFREIDIPENEAVAIDEDDGDY